MPAPYPFKQIEAWDPSNPSHVASNGQILIFAPGDPLKTPLTLTDLSATITFPNPVTVTAEGFGPAFMADLDQVAWEGGGFTGTFESYRGMKDAATAAEASSEASATSSAQSAQSALDAADNAATAAAAGVQAQLAATAQEATDAKTAAQQAAQLVNAPADTVTAALVGNTATATGAALSAAIGTQTGPSGAVDQMTAAAYPPMIGGDAPTVTISVGSTSPIAASITEGRDSRNVRFYGLTPRWSTLGGADVIENITGGSTSGGGGSYATEFYAVDAKVAVRYFLSAGAGLYRVWVDGQPLSYQAAKPGPNAGNLVWLLLTFPSAKRRLVRIEHTWMNFAAVSSVAGTTRPPAREAIRCAVVGDSWAQGGAAYDGGWPTNMTTVFQRLMGWDVLQAAIGGTGYSKGKKFGDPDRVAAVVAYKPHYVVVVGSVNDKDVNDPALVQSDAAAYYAALATQLPSTKVVVIGPQRVKNAADTMPAVRDAVKTAALAAPNVVAFIDPIAEQWINGDGTVTAPTGRGNSDVYIYTDGVHPTLTGAAYYGSRMATAVAQGLERAGIRWPIWSGPAIADPLEPAPIPEPEVLTDILLTGLLVEIDTRTLSLADGASVSALAPKRGSKTDTLTATTPPVFVLADTHGKKAIKRTGTQALLAPAWAESTAPGAPLTFYMVHNLVSAGTAGTQYMFRGGSTAAYRPSFAHSATDGAYWATAQAGAKPSGQTAKTGWRIDCITLGNQIVNHWQNKAAKTGTAPITTNAQQLNGISFGEVGGGTTGYELHQSLVLAYEGLHTDAQVAKMMTFLASDWGITLD